MKVVHLPNSHLYHQHLSPALREVGIEVDLRTYGWGTDLPAVAKEVLASGAEIIHLHWPEALCPPPPSSRIRRMLHRLSRHPMGRTEKQMKETLRQLRDGGCKLIWTLHNLYPHGAAGSKRAAYKRIYQAFAEMADGVVHHSRCGEERAKKTYTFRPDCRHVVIPFGVFPDEAPQDLTPAAARRALDLPPEELVLLTVGAIGPRKRLPLIVKAVANLTGIPCCLIVVGNGKAEVMHRLSAQGKGRIRFLGKLDQPALSQVARAADALVFAPEPDQLTTGGPHISESFLKPQLTTDTPYVREVLEEAAIYFEPTEDGLQKALKEWARDRAAPSGIVSKLAEKQAAHSWAESARKTAMLYADVLDSEGRTP